MIPSKTDPRWKELVEGKVQHDFSFVAAGLCLSRNQQALRLKRTTVDQAVDDLHAFFQKYEHILETDIKAIFK